MEKLLIGDVIYTLRKEKGITQEQLANFIGVSTAAVSKWESGISYPDITLLPVIATLFNVSIDRLLNFKISLSDEEVMDIFKECEKLFSSGKIDEAIEKSKNFVSQYPHSFYLKLRIGFLFSMYSWKAVDEENSMNMIYYSIQLFEDVTQNSTKPELVEQGLYQLGALYPTVKEDDKAIEALNKLHKSQLDPNTLLANIHIKKKEFKKARQILQGSLFRAINNLSIASLGLANSYIDDEKDLEIIEKYYNLSIGIKKAISPDMNSSLGLSTEYFNFAHIYLKFNEGEKALDSLGKMIEGMRIHDINNPTKLSSIWCFNEIPQGERTITMNLYENIFKIFEGSEFDSIRNKEEFMRIINELKALEKKSLNKCRIKDSE